MKDQTSKLEREINELQRERSNYADRINSIENKQILRAMKYAGAFGGIVSGLSGLTMYALNPEADLSSTGLFLTASFVAGAYVVGCLHALTDAFATRGEKIDLNHYKIGRDAITMNIDRLERDLQSNVNEK